MPQKWAWNEPFDWTEELNVSNVDQINFSGLTMDYICVKIKARDKEALLAQISQLWCKTASPWTRALFLNRRANGEHIHMHKRHGRDFRTDLYGYCVALRYDETIQICFTYCCGHASVHLKNIQKTFQRVFYFLVTGGLLKGQYNSDNQTSDRSQTHQPLRRSGDTLCLVVNISRDTELIRPIWR